MQMNVTQYVCCQAGLAVFFWWGRRGGLCVGFPSPPPAWLLAVWTRCVPRPAGSVANQASFLMAVLTWGNVMMGNWAGDGSHEVTHTILCPDIYQKLSVSPQGEPI